MPRRKKGAVRPGHGARCLICGLECGRGGSLKTHVEGAHKVDYKLAYKRCFKGGNILTNDASVAKGSDIMVQTRVVRIPPKKSN
jgi:hypothetical protein